MLSFLSVSVVFVGKLNLVKNLRGEDQKVNYFHLLLFKINWKNEKLLSIFYFIYGKIFDFNTLSAS